MNMNLGFCLALHRAHASLQLTLDDELGTHHGISLYEQRYRDGLLGTGPLVQPGGAFVVL